MQAVLVHPEETNWREIAKPTNGTSSSRLDWGRTKIFKNDRKRRVKFRVRYSRNWKQLSRSRRRSSKPTELDARGARAPGPSTALHGGPRARRAARARPRNVEGRKLRDRRHTGPEGAEGWLRFRLRVDQILRLCRDGRAT